MVNFLKGAFLGTAMFTGYNPTVPDFAAYDKITFYGGDTGTGGCIIDKVHGENKIMTKDYILSKSNLEFSPKWDLDTYLLCEFDRNFAGGNVVNITSPITDWLIYRSEVGSNQLDLIKEIDVKQEEFIDFTALKERTYIYYLFGKNDTEISSPLVTEEVYCDYYGWFLIDVDNKKSYIFDLNLSDGSIAQNEAVAEYTTNLKYNAYSRGNTDFISGTITALVMDDWCNMTQSVDYVEELREFILSDRKKYVKDRKGRIFRVFTSGYVDSMITSGLKGEPRYITFTFKEMGDV